MSKLILIIAAQAGTTTRAWARLLGQEGFHVTVASLTAAESAAKSDLIVMDAALLEFGGRTLLEQPEVRAAQPKVLFVAAEFTAETVLSLSAHGDLVLPAPVDADTLVSAVQQLFKTEDHVVRFAETYKLSPREAALLRFALQGRNNDQAAGDLGCSRATVATYWNRIFRKTGVSGQRDVIILLLRSRHGSGKFPRSHQVDAPLPSKSSVNDK